MLIVGQFTKIPTVHSWKIGRLPASHESGNLWPKIQNVLFLFSITSTGHSALKQWK